MRADIPRCLAVSAALLSVSGALGAQPCQPSWLPGDGVPGVDGSVNALCSWDPDGPGPQPALVVAAGNFRFAGTANAVSLAAWDGSSWHAICPPAMAIPGYAIDAVMAFPPDNSAPQSLVVAGTFTADASGHMLNHIARWNGAGWDTLDGGANDRVSALGSFSQGNSAVLIAGGSFTSIGGQPAFHVAAFDGQRWSQVGGGTDGTVSALITYDPDGPGPRGPALIAGGYFMHAGAVSTSSIASWDGSVWSPLGSGISGGIEALAVLVPVSGPSRLFAGGQFSSAGGVPASNVAQWDGAAWTSLGSGVHAEVKTLAVHDPDGPGPRPPVLFAGGGWPILPSRYSDLAAWDGSSWTGISPPLLNLYDLVSISALLSIDLEGSPHLIVGGPFTCADTTPLSGIADWHDDAWHPLGTGLGRGMDSTAIRALNVADLGATGHPVLVAGGDFSVTGTIPTEIAAWDGERWHPFPGGADGTVESLHVFDFDGAGPQPPQLAAGGYFAAIGGVTAIGVARYEHGRWAQIGGGLSAHLGQDVLALTSFDADGSGPLPEHLIAGGNIGTGTYRNIGELIGTTWRLLGGGARGYVFALATFDEDGPGPAPAPLFVGGGLISVGGGSIPVSGIARWDGTQWSTVGGDVAGGVYSMLVFDPDGNGPRGLELIVAGSFTSAGGAPAGSITAWNGYSWHALGAGMAGGVYGTQVNALCAFDPDGDGPLPSLLIAGGDFTQADGAPAAHIASWDGAAWSPLGEGTDGQVLALASFHPGWNPALPPQLAVGGYFHMAGGHASVAFARWGCPAPAVCYANCDGSTAEPILDMNDFFCFLQRFAAGDPYANCDGSFDPPALNVNDFLCFQARFAAGCP